jgi:hypothetical protein
MKKFLTFLESLKDTNITLIEGIKEGFKVCFEDMAEESFNYPWRLPPHELRKYVAHIDDPIILNEILSELVNKIADIKDPELIKKTIMELTKPLDVLPS